MRWPWRARDEGSASIYVLSISFAVLAVAVGLGAVSVARIARATAASAADLSALAGAGASARGEDACQRAREIAVRGRAAAVSCDVGPDGVVSVVVEVPLRGAMARWGAARAHARAGPAGLEGPAG